MSKYGTPVEGCVWCKTASQQIDAATYGEVTEAACAEHRVSQGSVAVLPMSPEKRYTLTMQIEIPTFGNPEKAIKEAKRVLRNIRTSSDSNAAGWFGIRTDAPFYPGEGFLEPVECDEPEDEEHWPERREL